MPLDPHAETAQLNSPSTLERIYQHAPVGLCVLDRQLRYVRINDFLARLNGIPPEAHIGRTVREIIPPVADVVEGIAERVFRTGQPELITEGPGFDTTQPDRPGVWRAAWHPIHNPSGQVIGLNVVVEDITARRRAERALQESLDSSELRVRERTSALAESERLYRRLAENTLDILFDLDVEGHITFIGPQVARYGYDTAAMAGRHFRDYVHPEDLPAVQAWFDRNLAEGEQPPLEFRVETPRLGPRWFEDRGATRRDEAGRAIGFTGVLRDITERHQAVIALRENEEKYRRLFELETSGILLADLHTGEILDVNPAATTIYGYTREEFLAVNARAVSTEPEATAAFVERLKSAGHAEASPRWHRRKDGARVPLDLRAVRMNWQGREVMFAVVHDITERLAREEAQRASEEKYRQLFTLDTNGVILISMETKRVLDANDAALRLYGYTREEFLALDVRALTAEPDATDALVVRLKSDGRAHAEVRYHRRKDGTLIPLELDATLFNLAGQTVTFLAVRDIQERLARDAENLHQREALSRLASQVATAAEQERQRLATELHDNLIQLLVSCQVRLDQAAQKPKNPGNPAILRRVWEILDQAVRDTRNLTFRLAPPALEQIGLPAALEQMCAELGEAYTVPFDFRVTGTPFAVPPLILQLVYRCGRELAVNAGRHARAHRVDLELAYGEDYLALLVRDDGVGFDAHRAGHDFSASGGYGLFSARQQLLHAGGALSIQSAPGRGSCVVIRFPREELTRSP